MRLFQDSFIFGEAPSSHFFSVTASTQQLLFRSSCFFRESRFLKSSFFRTVTSWQQLFFQNSYFFRAKLLPSNHLRIGSSLGYLLFGTATFLAVELFRIKISTEELLFRSRYLYTASTFSEKLHFGKKLIFRKRNIPHYPLPENYLLRTAIFSKDVIFYRSYLFRRTTSLYHSYASFPQLHLLFIS